MRTIARINADGSLLLKGHVFELIASWADTQDIDEEFIVDEQTEIDDDLNWEMFVEILTGLKNQWEDVDDIFFDNKGNLFTKAFIEQMSGFLTADTVQTSNNVLTTDAIQSDSDPSVVFEKLLGVTSQQVSSKGLRFKDDKRVYGTLQNEGVDL